MKNLPLILASFMLVLFFACGSDTATNQTPSPGEEVIFSMDSFAINLTSGVILTDTNIQINNSLNIKVIFDVSTNVDSLNSFALYRILAIDSSNTFLDSVNNAISTLNSTQSIALNGSISYLLKLSIQLNQTGVITVFIRMKNINLIRMR